MKTSHAQHPRPTGTTSTSAVISSAAREPGHYALALAMVRRIIEDRHGQIWWEFQSEEQGTRTHIMPLAVDSVYDSCYAEE